MPPRYVYWTIVIDGKPTAFRAQEKSELLPTLRQLQRTNKDAALKWFARGRAWESPEAERAASNRPPPRDTRGQGWRPGGKAPDARGARPGGRPPDARGPRPGGTDRDTRAGWRPSGAPPDARGPRPGGKDRDTRGGWRPSGAPPDARGPRPGGTDRDTRGGWRPSGAPPDARGPRPGGKDRDTRGGWRPKPESREPRDRFPQTDRRPPRPPQDRAYPPPTGEERDRRRVSHVVLMKPRPDLSPSDRQALIGAFERALRDIPTVRDVRVGRRVKHGAGYESLAPDAADYLIVIDFDDLAGLRAYLDHPAHRELGERFSQSLAASLVYDFELGPLEGLIPR